MRDLKFSSTVDSSLYVACVSIAPAAELEAECKVGRHESTADDFTVLFDDGFRFRSEKDKEFQHATNGAEGEARIRHGGHICVAR